MRRKIASAIESWRGHKRNTCLLVYGARQVGKTYSITEFIRSNYENHLILDLSKDGKAIEAFKGDKDVDSIVQRLSTIYDDVDFVPGRTAIFIDEIQNSPDARTALKSFGADGRYDVIASGSLLGLNLEAVGDYPVGYVTRVPMYPMDFEEFLWATGLSEDIIAYARERILNREPFDGVVLSGIYRRMREYMIVGGMPAAVREFSETKKFDGVRRMHQDILADYRDDISKHAERKDRVRIRSILESIPVQLSKENKRFLYSDVEKEEDYNVGTRQYEDPREWLREAGLSQECECVRSLQLPLGFHRDKSRFKIYFNDTGLLLSMYGPELRFDILNGNIHVNSGALTENLIAQMLVCQSRELLYYSRLRSTRTKEDGTTEPVRGIELDFVVSVEGRVTAVEVESGREKKIKSLDTAMSEFRIAGIELDDGNVRTDDKGVLHLPLFAAAFMECVDPPRPEPNYTDEIDLEERLRLIRSGRNGRP